MQLPSPRWPAGGCPWGRAVILCLLASPALAQDKRAAGYLERFSVSQEDWQQDKLCGVNCLCVFLRSHGSEVSHRHLLESSRPWLDNNGISMGALRELAREHGVNARVVRAAPEQLQHVPFPAIAHLGEGFNDHYVVIQAASGNKLVLLDGTLGTSEEIDIEVFTASWSGHLLVVEAPSWRRRARVVLYALMGLCGLLVVHSFASRRASQRRG